MKITFYDNTDNSFETMDLDTGVVKTNNTFVQRNGSSMVHNKLHDDSNADSIRNNYRKLNQQEDEKIMIEIGKEIDKDSKDKVDLDLDELVETINQARDWIKSPTDELSLLKNLVGKIEDNITAYHKEIESNYKKLNQKWIHMNDKLIINLNEVEMLKIDLRSAAEELTNTKKKNFLFNIVICFAAVIAGSLVTVMFI